MAVLGKIRSKGALLVGIIGLGLFAFIAEEAFRSCDSTRNAERQTLAVVLGEKITYQDYQNMVDEYVDVIKMQQGRENLNEDELNQVRDMVWNQYLQSALIANEAEKLGLRVTDEEIRNILNEGQNPMLMQTPFVNQQTGRFDANSLKQFISEYKKAQSANPQQAEQMRPVYNYWTFTEKMLRQQILQQKYQALLANSLIVNKIEVKQAQAEDAAESSIDLAVLPYSTIADKDVQVSDADLKAKWEEMKQSFKQYEETRDIKFVSVQVAASPKDRAALTDQVKDFGKQLATAEDPSEIVRKSGSDVPYIGVPVLKTAFPGDIQQTIDSIAVGSTTEMKLNANDNTMNVVRLISKQELPDSVQFQAIQVGGASIEEAHNRADSIMGAIAADASQWDAIAKKYGQTGEKQWITTQQYMGAPSLDADTKTYLTTLNTAGVGETKKISTANGDIIVKITDRKAFVTKYVAAVLKVNIDFSKDTYSQAYNKFSQYVSESQDLAALEKNAKAKGYTVRDLKDVRSSQHLIAGIHGTHEALKWVFEAEKEGAVSPLYECGENDNLLVLVMTKIHEKGYRTIDDEQVKEMVKQEVLKDKKAEKLIAKLQGAKSTADAKAKGAQTTVLDQITFAAPAFVALTGSSEPALSGAVAGTAVGKLSRPVKGNGGVYLFKVLSKKNRTATDAKTVEDRLTQRAMQGAGNFMQELFINADVKDNRYMFF